MKTTQTDKIHSLICTHRKIVIPKLLETQIREWYHNALWHSGEVYTEYGLLNISIEKTNLKQYMKSVLKRNRKQYVRFSPKEAETKRGDTLCVDLIGK